MIPRRVSCLLRVGMLTAIPLATILIVSILDWTSGVIKRNAPNIGQAKVTTKPVHLNLKAAKMTFDPDLVVYCKDSPYVICERTPVRQLNKTFKIASINYKIWFHEAAFAMKKCEYKNCIFQGENVTGDADIVAVYSVLIDQTRPLPKRWPNQTYIFMGWEAPYLFYGFLQEKTSPWNRIFNLTMSYRVDSDIFTPYNKLIFRPLPVESRPNYMEIAKSKNKTVVWLISHCQAESKREEYIKTMRKYVDLDIFGRCGEECPSDCVRTLATTYKFYIAFENTLCTDYVTEKFFKNFNRKHHIIPVVRGGANYGKHFPENTFINAANFKNAKALALYLKRLGSDLETYSKYLEYKDLYLESYDYQRVAGCTLCEQLNTKQPKPKLYNAYDWFVEGHCNTDPEDMW